MPNWPEPVKINPLIKLSRYTFLIAGIFYGASRYQMLKMKEAGEKEARLIAKKALDKRIALEKKAASDRDCEEIAVIFGMGPEGTRQDKIVDNEDYAEFKDIQNKLIFEINKQIDSNTNGQNSEKDTLFTDECKLEPIYRKDKTFIDSRNENVFKQNKNM